MRNSHKKAMILKYRLILMIKVANSGLHYFEIINQLQSTKIIKAINDKKNFDS